MRKFRITTIAGALLAVVALLAAGCGSSKKTSSTTNTTTAATPTTALPGIGKKIGMVFDIGGKGDKSFNDSAWAGLSQAVTDFGVTEKDLSPASGGENREELLRLLTTDGYPLIFAVGFLFTDSVTKVAAENTGTKYGIIDATIPNAPNVASLTFAEEQGSYLVGAAAALKSKAGNIGFIGGVDTPLIKKFEAGYVAGAKKINPNIKIQIKYLTEPPDFSGFSDPAKGKEAALGMYSNGADVVYHAAGGSGIGLFQAARDTSAKGSKVWAIGVDSDQYNSVGDASVQPYILTSMMKKVNVAVYDTIKAFVAGTLVTGTNQVFDLKSGGIDYSTSGGFIDDIKAQLDSLKQQIINGQITVPTQP